jgi:hypothetical protein
LIRASNFAFSLPCEPMKETSRPDLPDGADLPGGEMGASRGFRLIAVLALLVSVPACAQHRCVPPDLAKRRDLIDLCATEIREPVEAQSLHELAADFQRRAATQHPPGARPYHFLALSGGGLFGAYGVGVLNGWTQSGTRPTFDAVTGVSTGALIATFAFLGPQYDCYLHENLVGLKPKEVLPRNHLLAVPFVGSLLSPRALSERIDEAITPQILAEVAQAHAAGRRLYIATTSLDARRLIVWDMGAIAMRGDEEALKLYHKVILASASVPGAFPPVVIPVEIDGVRYEELHFDGGISDRVFFRSAMVADLNRLAGVPGAWAPPGSTLHVINNGKLYAEPSCTRGAPSQLVASFDEVYSNKTRDEMYRIYLNCLQTGVAFRATSIPQELEIPRNSLMLDADHQVKLFEAGVQVGRGIPTGTGWRDDPPGIQPGEQALPRTGTRFATPGSVP